MSLKLRILRSLTRLFIILVSLRMSLFIEKMLIFNRCISGLMSNMIKKSWRVSNIPVSMKESGLLEGWWGSTFGSNRRIVFLLLTNFLRSRSIHSVSLIIITKKPDTKFVKMFYEIKQKYFVSIYFYSSNNAA